MLGKYLSYQFIFKNQKKKKLCLEIMNLKTFKTVGGIMCCKDCQDRIPACHSKCAKYQAYREKLEIAKQNRARHYTTARAGYEITLKKKLRSNKPLGNMRVC